MGAQDIQQNGPHLANAVIGGTKIIGHRAGTSIVPAKLCLHDHNNLHTLGTSAHLSCSVNAPSLTIAAMAIRLAEHLTNNPNE